MVAKNKNLLLIFAKNPEKGKVKTRLAKSVGEEKAYHIYLALLSHTLKEALQVDTDKQIWYSSFVDYEDEFDREHFKKFVQKGDDLGDRMKKAFGQGYADGYKRVVVIGSDCPGISKKIIDEAFEKLEDHNVVVGPSEDGGYYLLGMRDFYPQLFSEIEWSTENVLPETIIKIRKSKLTFHELPVLNDIDTEEDLMKSNFGHEI